MGDEILEVEGGSLDAAGGGCRREWQVQANSRVEQCDEDEAERERNQAGEDEPADSARAHPPERRDVAHVGDAGDEGREHQRRDDHLDQAEENGGDDAQIIGDGLEPGGACRRAVVDGAVDRPAS